jgi:hypothetical protein
LIQWAVILAGFALVAGVINLIRVHWERIASAKPTGIYSAVLLAAFAVTVVIGTIVGPTGKFSLFIFQNIQIPLETSFLALLAIVLVVAVIRMFRKRLNAFSVIFLVSALLVMIAATPLLRIGEVPALYALRSILVQWFSVAGARGLLLGVALGMVITGVRVLLGADRPYGG